MGVGAMGGKPSLCEQVLQQMYAGYKRLEPHLEVMLVDGHLEVQARELAQVAVRVAVLGTEHRPDLEHSLEVRAECHLLV